MKNLLCNKGFLKKGFSEIRPRLCDHSLYLHYWKITIETIEYCKNFVESRKQLFVSGVLVTLLHNELERETGIKPMKGLLDEPGILDPKRAKAKNIVVDDLPLDYSILDEIDYEYPT